MAVPGLSLAEQMYQKLALLGYEDKRTQVLYQYWPPDRKTHE
ncbi:hypothetical protein [Paenibacillus donghaensis]